MFDLLLVAASAAAIAGQPATLAARYVGVWNLDLARSDLAGEHQPPEYRHAKAISWNGAALTETDDFQNVAFIGQMSPGAQTKLELAPDGVEREIAGISRFPVLPPAKMTASASWQGDNLVVTARGSDFMGYWRTTRRYFLSPDGATLTELISQTGTDGDGEERLVFTRAKAD